MRTGLFTHWSVRSRVVFLLLWVAAVAATTIALRSVRETEADLNLSFERCILDTPRSFGLSGFSPVSECLLSRIDTIHLGPGRIAVSGEGHQEAAEVSLHLVGSRPSSVVEITGRDLALGRLGIGPGRLDVQSPGANRLSVDFVPSPDAEESRGELSLGDSCRFRTRGYELRIDGVSVAPQPGEERTGVFYPFGGAGHLIDEEGGFGFQVKVVDRAFEFTTPTRISAIRFLNSDGQCAGVSGGSIRVAREKVEASVPRNACVRVDAEELQLRYLGMAAGSSHLSVALSGRLRSLELNQSKLVSRPTLAAILIGLSFLLIFGAAAVGARRLMDTRGIRRGGSRQKRSVPGEMRSMTDHVFISHSHHDKRYARELAQAMRERGFLVWLDDDIRVGTRFSEELQEMIENCAAFVVVVTPKSLKSDWVNGELAHATDWKKKVFPLLVRGEALPLAVKSIQSLDVREGNLPPEQFHETLAKWAPTRPDIAELSKKERQEREDAVGRIRAAGGTAFKCDNCGFPVPYDAMTGAAMALLFGLPFIGGAVVHYLYGWLAAAVSVAVAVAVVGRVLSTGEELFREPSRCPDCGAGLGKRLSRYGQEADRLSAR